MGGISTNWAKRRILFCVTGLSIFLQIRTIPTVGELSTLTLT